MRLKFLINKWRRGKQCLKINVACVLKCHIVCVSVQAHACTVREHSKGEMFWAVCLTFAHDSMSKCFVFNIVTVCFDSLNTGGPRLSNDNWTEQRVVRQRTSQ